MKSGSREQNRPKQVVGLLPHGGSLIFDFPLAGGGENCRALMFNDEPDLVKQKMRGSGILGHHRSWMVLPIIDAMTSASHHKSPRLQNNTRKRRIAASTDVAMRNSLKLNFWMQWKVIAALSLVAILTVLVWLPALHFGFVYDDHLQIESNPQLQSWSGLGHALREPLWTQLGPEKASPYYRPLFLLTLFVQHLFWGSNPLLWHLVSICLHTLVALALFLFLYLQFERLPPACIGTCIFAFSPLATEVVSWISACSESLYTLLFLCALCGLVLSGRAKTPSKALMLRLSSTCALALAVFAKETAIVAVALALAYEYLFLVRKPRFRMILVYTPLILPLAAYLWVHPSQHHTESRALVHVLSTAPYVGWLALRKLVLPVPVSEFYDVWLDQVHSLTSLATHIGLLICVIGAILWVGSRSKLVAWMLAVVVLPLTVVVAGSFFFRDYDLFHDRYLYLSSTGVAMLVAALIARIETRPRIRLFTAVAVILILCVEIWQSRLASQQFRDDVSLFSHAVDVAPHNVVALQLLAETAIGRSDCPTAIESYQRAQQLRPDLWKASFFLGIGYLRCGQSAHAADAFGRAATVPGATTNEAALAWYELGRVNLVQQNVPNALISLRRAASLDPASRKIKMLLTQILSEQQQH
jgi:protein O-mannosyl-transferase